MVAVWVKLGLLSLGKTMCNGTQYAFVFRPLKEGEKVTMEIHRRERRE